MTGLKEDGDTIIIQTKVPERTYAECIEFSGDGESYTEGDWFLWNMWLLRMITDH